MNEIIHFASCCEDGAEPVSGGRDNLETMKIVFGIYESAQTGRWWIWGVCRGSRAGPGSGAGTRGPGLEDRGERVPARGPGLGAEGSGSSTLTGVFQDCWDDRVPDALGQFVADALHREQG